MTWGILLWNSCKKFVHKMSTLRAFHSDYLYWQADQYCLLSLPILWQVMVCCCQLLSDALVYTRLCHVFIWMLAADTDIDSVIQLKVSGGTIRWSCEVFLCYWEGKVKWLAADIWLWRVQGCHLRTTRSKLESIILQNSGQRATISGSVSHPDVHAGILSC